MEENQTQNELKEEKKKDPTGFIYDLLKDILVSLVIIVIMINFIAIPVQVDGTSMDPNLKDGALGFSGIFTKWFGFNRFDVVVIDSPKSENRLVKRIIALPNETIKYEDNKLYINGTYIEESFLGEDKFTEDFEVTLKDNEYFVLGDNRDISKDSRYYGPFNAQDFIAKGVLTLWPLTEIGID